MVPAATNAILAAVATPWVLQLTFIPVSMKTQYPDSIAHMYCTMFMATLMPLALWLKVFKPADSGLTKQ